MKEYKASSPATQKIADLLTGAFNKIESKLKAELKEAYRRGAKGGFDSFMRAISDPMKTGVLRGNEFRGWHEYADFDRKAAEEAVRKVMDPYPPSYLNKWEDLRTFKKYIKLDYTRADRDSEDAFDSARDSFLYKNMAKVEKVLERRREIKNAIVLFDFRRGVFEGNLQVYLQDGYFRAEVGLKYVVRYIPRTTPYFQYPLVFTDAEIAGKSYKRPSEEELRVLLGGLSMEKLIEAKKAKAARMGWCPASGTEVPSALMAGQWNKLMPWAKCVVCGAGVSAQHGKYRKHKTPAAAKGEAAKKLEASGYCPKSREKVSPEVIAAMGPVEPYKDPKVACEHCGQMTRLDAEKDWIPVPGGAYSTHMKVKSARYYKHKLPSATS